MLAGQHEVRHFPVVVSEADEICSWGGGILVGPFFSDGGLIHLDPIASGDLMDRVKIGYDGPVCPNFGLAGDCSLPVGTRLRELHLRMVSSSFIALSPFPIPFVRCLYPVPNIAFRYMLNAIIPLSGSTRDPSPLMQRTSGWPVACPLKLCTHFSALPVTLSICGTFLMYRIVYRSSSQSVYVLSASGLAVPVSSVLTVWKIQVMSLLVTLLA